jgi:hypothetical protein
MEKSIKINPLTDDELILWNSNQLVNPRTNRKINKDCLTYAILKREYYKMILRNKEKQMFNINPKPNIETIEIKDEEPEISSLEKLEKILLCMDDRDPISMNIFWSEKNNIKTIVYPLEDLDNLVFYNDIKNNLRCLEKETLKYLKTYNITKHPVTNELIPEELFKNIISINLEEIKLSINELALDVFQLFTKKSIFISHESFMLLDKTKLLKFNHEIKDIWIQNLTQEQRNEISIKPLFVKDKEELLKYKLEDIQKYLLENMKTVLKCDNKNLSFMIFYILVGSLGIVIPEIKEAYSDISFSFS